MKKVLKNLSDILKNSSSPYSIYNNSKLIFEACKKYFCNFFVYIKMVNNC